MFFSNMTPVFMAREHGPSTRVYRPWNEPNYILQVQWRWCCDSEKLTMLMHWPRVTDLVVYPRTGSRPRTGRWGPPYALVEAWYS